MEDFIEIDYKKIFNQIKQMDGAHQYAACLKFLDLIRPYLCKCTIISDEKYFFRVRAHLGQGKPYFFYNIQDLTYRTDFFNISKFGRCNCPFESVFYCSDHPLLALAEVSRMIWKENKNRSAYFTTSIWRMNGNIHLTPLLESNDDVNYNSELYSITQNCMRIVEEMDGYKKKDELKEFHTIMGREFARPFQSDDNIYLFSAAVANYLLAAKNNESEKIDGLVYASCLDISNIRRLGLNYAFDPMIVGDGRAIRFMGAFRSKLQRKKDGIYETDQHYCKQICDHTGELQW
jgi:hypothetical protein